jgi:hypothetical protein
MILGNAMTIREPMVQSGATSPAEEMVQNLGITSPGEYSQDDIDRLYTDEGVPAE